MSLILVYPFVTYKSGLFTCCVVVMHVSIYLVYIWKLVCFVSYNDISLSIYIAQTSDVSLLAFKLLLSNYCICSTN